MGWDGGAAQAIDPPTDDERAEAPVRPRGPRAPRWAFHAVLALDAACLVWAWSVPGTMLLPVLLGQAVLVVLGVVWLALLVRWAWARAHGRDAGPGWGFLVGPVVVVVLAAVLQAGVPLQARWALAEPSFEAIVADLAPAEAGGFEPIEVDGRVGSYDIVAAHQAGGGVFFEEGDGGFVAISGFAHLPAGPIPAFEAGYESIRYVHLRGDWYTFSAGW